MPVAPSKCRINDAIVSLWKTGKRFAVLDDPMTGCRTTRAILRVNPSAVVHCISNNPAILNFAARFPANVEIHHDLASDVLDDLVEREVTLNGVFLDYCATPTRSKGFDWVEDVRLCAEYLLMHRALVFVTFSKRNYPHANTFVQTMVRDHLPTLQLVDLYEYCDTSPMGVYTLAVASDWRSSARIPCISSLILPTPGQRVQVRDASGVWCGNVVRMVSMKEVEVHADCDKKTWTVDVCNVSGV